MVSGFRRAALVALGGLALMAAPASADVLSDNLSQLTEQFASGYLDPLNSGLNSTLNSGIFRSGDVPFVGLNFTLDLKAAIVSFGDDSKTYTPDVPTGFTTGEVSTVVGSTEATALSGPGGAQLVFPGGLDLDHFGVAVPQLTIGSVMGTRAILRWISLEIGDEEIGDLSLFGIGAQHSVSRYFPGLPVEVAAGIMYQTFDLGKDIINASALALNVTASKKFGRIVSIEPYVGLGIDSFKMDSQYDLTDSAGNVLEEIKVDFDRDTSGRLTLGTGLNLPVVKLHGEYNVAAENGYTVGVSFGI